MYTFYFLDSLESFFFLRHLDFFTTLISKDESSLDMLCLHRQEDLQALTFQKYRIGP